MSFKFYRKLNPQLDLEKLSHTNFTKQIQYNKQSTITSNKTFIRSRIRLQKKITLKNEEKQLILLQVKQKQMIDLLFSDKTRHYIEQLEINKQKQIEVQYFSYQFISVQKFINTYGSMKKQQIKFSSQIIKSPYWVEVQKFKDKVDSVFDSPIQKTKKKQIIPNINDKINDFEQIKHNQNEYKKIIQRIFNDY